MFRSAVVPLAALALGCALHAYPGPARPDAEVALIRPSYALHRAVYLEEIDHEPVGPLRGHVVVLPGEHALRATLFTHVGARRLEGAHELSFVALPGHEYLVDGAWGLYGARLWVVDLESQERVAEAHGPPRSLPPVGSAR